MHTLLSKTAQTHIEEIKATTYDILNPDFLSNPFLTKRDKEKLMTLRQAFTDYTVDKIKTVTVTSSSVIGNHLVNIHQHETQEHVSVVSLNTKNDVISIDKIFTGSLDTSVAHPREIFKTAIKHSASRIILVHNHPSGNTEPSQADIKLTRRVVESGIIIGIECLDHMIVGDDYLSMREHGLM